MPIILGMIFTNLGPDIYTLEVYTSTKFYRVQDITRNMPGNAFVRMRLTIDRPTWTTWTRRTTCLELCCLVGMELGSGMGIII